jgi:alkanesulfonate monooxygenase SsuD/methylene tetrahydromethanopterin reductase-like flavin-dependent oxidoreductase (luciferase family)
MDTTGVTLGSRGREDLFDYVEIAEERGLDTIWVGESYGAAAVPLLTRLLEHTDAIDVCSGILNVYARTPALVAMTANSLAAIDDGRFRLGLGTSSQAVIERFHGVDFDRPLRRTREYVEIVRAFQSGKRVDYDGDLFELSGFAIDADQTHETPIYLAAMGEQNRELAGAVGDGWIPLMVPNTALDDALDAVRAGADRAGRSLSNVDVAPWVPTCVSERDPEAAREAVRSLIGFYVGAMGDYYANAATAFGFGDAADAIREGWRENRQAGADAAVTDEMVDAFGAAGSPAEAAASAERFVAAGADNPVAYVPAKWAEDSLVRETITHL